MDLTLFDKMQTPPLCVQEGESQQMHMERIFRLLCNCTGQENPKQITEMLRPRFLSCNVEEKQLCLGFFVEDWMLNLNGTLHGGLVSSMLDTTMGLLARYFAEESTVATLHLTTDFLSRIGKNTDLAVTACLLKQGSRICFLTGEVTAIGGRQILVSGTSSFMPVRRKAPSDLGKSGHA